MGELDDALGPEPARAVRSLLNGRKTQRMLEGETIEAAEAEAIAATDQWIGAFYSGFLGVVAITPSTVARVVTSKAQPEREQLKWEV